ncbi:hypothetical protein [Mucilaginibacter sp. HD30]
MNNPVNPIDKVLKTKEDLQSFVLAAFFLFIIFVKCYMMLTSLNANNAVSKQRNTEITKTQTRASS